MSDSFLNRRSVALPGRRNLTRLPTQNSEEPVFVTSSNGNGSGPNGVAVQAATSGGRINLSVRSPLDLVSR
jgi:hypothetical protein